MAIVITNLLDTLANPSDAFTSLKQRPRWLVTFIIISVITIITAFLIHPFTLHLMTAMLAEQFKDHEVEQILGTSLIFTYIGYSFSPVFLLLRWLIIAALLYFIAVLFNSEQLTYQTTLASVVHAEIILVVMNIVNVIILYFQGIDTVTDPVHLQAIVGLDFLMHAPADNKPLFILLNNINIFSIWYLSVLTIGYSIITGFSKIKSMVIVGSVWLLTIFYQAAVAAISEISL
jgi:hypothetical protein